MRDFDRACQWCKKLEEFTERLRIQFVNGVCRAHYAAVLTWRGDWAEAEGVLVEAQRSLAAIRPFWVPEATVRLADLRRRQGRFDEAERLFAEAESHPLAVLGAAELWLDRDRPREAIPLAERMLRQLPLENRTQRGAALGVMVRGPAVSRVCQAVCTVVAAAVWDPGRSGASTWEATAFSAWAVARRSGPYGRGRPGAMQTSQAQAPATAATARWPGTWAGLWGTKRAAEVTNVKMTLAGGPIRLASHRTFWSAAIFAPTGTRTTACVVSEAVTRATASPATMPSTTRARVRARAA